MLAKAIQSVYIIDSKMMNQKVGWVEKAMLQAL
jgi:hypothetical protein